MKEKRIMRNTCISERFLNKKKTYKVIQYLKNPLFKFYKPLQKYSTGKITLYCQLIEGDIITGSFDKYYTVEINLQYVYWASQPNYSFHHTNQTLKNCGYEFVLLL